MSSPPTPTKIEHKNASLFVGPASKDENNDPSPALGRVKTPNKRCITGRRVKDHKSIADTLERGGCMQIHICVCMHVCMCVCMFVEDMSLHLACISHTHTHVGRFHLEDGVLGREEQVPPLVQRVAHARTCERSYRLSTARKSTPCATRQAY